VGGHTYRSRVLVVFKKRDHPAGLQGRAAAELSVRQLTDEQCEPIQLDRRNWLLQGQLSACGKYLQLGGELKPGALVTLKDSARQWRVQSSRGDTMVVRVAERRAQDKPRTVPTAARSSRAHC
jgi:hypothetical protein